MNGASPSSFAGLSFVVFPLLFATSGALLRLNLEHVESRLQVLLFWFLALTLELVLKWPFGQQPSPARFALNGVFATIAIALVKIWYEGLPFAG